MKTKQRNKMLKKFNCLRLVVIIIINDVINPTTSWADVNKNLKDNMQNRQDISTSGSRLFTDATNAWQPHVPRHKWLTQPTTFTTTAVTTTTTAPLMQSSKYKQHIYAHHNYHTHHYSTHYANQEEEQQQQQQQLQQQQQMHDYNGNYQKNHVNMPKLISSQVPPTKINSLTTSIDALKAGTKAFNSHESWLLYNPSNMIKTVHAQVQIPTNIISDTQRPIQSQPSKQTTSILSQLHLPQVTDIEEKNYHSNQHYHHYASAIWPDSMHSQSQSQYPSTISDIQQQHKHISFGSLKAHANITANGITDMKMKKKKENLNDNNILTKATQENFKTNEISNHNLIPNHDHDADDDKQFSEHNVLKTITTSSHHHGDDKYLNLKLTLLKKIFNNNQTFYHNSENIHRIPGDKRKRDSDRSDISYENDDETSYSYSRKDKIDKINDLKIIISMPHHLVVKSLSNTTAAVAVAAAVTAGTPAIEKHEHDILSVKEIQQPVGEVQGRKTQIAKDVMKHTFVSATPEIADKSKAMPTIFDTQATRRIWNVLTMPQTTLSSASMDSSTSKSLSREIVSGRKVKKVKKKLKKFLLPLLLAYKLKFITLLPLLVSGLVLLVGTTGLAGFFFALFMAVMSLKSSSRNAVVVKKY